MKFIHLTDARGRRVRAELNPDARFSAGREVLSDGTAVEPWMPREGVKEAKPPDLLKIMEKMKVRLEKLRVDRKKQKKLKRKAQRRGR